MKLRNVIRLGYRHKAFLLYSLCVVIVVRLALTASTYRKIAQRIQLKPRAGGRQRSPYLVAWAVRNTAILVPFAHCLTQALSAQFILARQGTVGVVRIGVAQRNGVVEAHAWLLHDDIVLLGGSDRSLEDYAVLTDLTPIAP